MIRYSIVAGQFYPDEPEALKSMIKSMIDEKAPKDKVLGLLCPHAGYIYSGPVAGACYSRVKMQETCVIIGPNHTGRGKPFSIITSGKWRTPLGNVEIDTELASKLASTSRFLRQDEEAHRFEHSIEVQIPFLQYFKPDVKIVPIIVTASSLETHRAIGLEIAKAIKDLKRNAIIIASSDMTHYEPADTARRKDEQAIRAMLEISEFELAEKIEKLDISMCGFAPAISLLAAMRELEGTNAELIKYATSGDVTGDNSSVVGYAGIIFKEMSPIVKLAKQTVETFVREQKIIAPPQDLIPELKGQAGVFVSIHKHGELRGCIGTFEPTRENIALEVIYNAISSATRDPRFSPIAANELKDLDYSVDILSPPEPVDSIEELDARRYGVIVESGWRRGLLLPDLDGVDTPEQQIEICRAKAGISDREKIKLYRFEVKRYR